MAARRSRGGYDGDGVRQLRPGVWELRFSLGPDPVKRQPNGRPVYRQKSVSFPGTKAEAKAQRQRLVDEHRPKTENRTDATFGELFEAWIEEATDLADSTVQAHRMLHEKHIKPALGAVKLRELSTRDVERFYSALHREKEEGGAGLHARSIRRVHAIINTALRRAMAWEWIDRNPAEFAKPPRVHGRPDTYTPTLIELQAAIVAAHDLGAWALAFVWTAAATGMRRGELCGLQWADIDGQAQTIHVRRAIVDVAGKALEKAPKTGKARVVEIPVELVAVLAAYEVTLEARQGDTVRGVTRTSNWVNEEGPVGPGPSSRAGPWLWSLDGGRTRVHPDKLTDTWNIVKAKAGIPKACRLHDLRHAYGTVLAEHGGERIIAAVADQLGHSDMTTTMRNYLASVTSGRRRAAGLIGQLLAGTVDDEPSP